MIINKVFNNTVVSEHVTKSDVLTGLSIFPSIEQKTPAPFKVENSVTL